MPQSNALKPCIGPWGALPSVAGWVRDEKRCWDLLKDGREEQ